MSRNRRRLYLAVWTSPRSDMERAALVSAENSVAARAEVRLTFGVEPSSVTPARTATREEDDAAW